MTTPVATVPSTSVALSVSAPPFVPGGGGGACPTRTRPPGVVVRVWYRACCQCTYTSCRCPEGCYSETSLITSASLLSQLPQIPRFNGQEEQADGETFLDWLEQFESVAVLGGWNDHYKLVHLTTKLRGAAYSFYRSCSPTQRSSYALLVEELKKRFTPVKLAAVQSQLFHDRQQGPKESVDEFAQDLRKLFAKAYAGVSRGGPEAEKMGQSVLANQFIGGLHSI